MKKSIIILKKWKKSKFLHFQPKKMKFNLN